MTSYNAVDGIPCTSNKWLLNDVLRENGILMVSSFQIWEVFGHCIATIEWLKISCMLRQWQ